MKTYVLTLSKVFPRTHINAGKPTNFREKFLSGKKIHIIQTNYSLWKKRIREVQEGQAVLSIRQWVGKSDCSKQVELAQLSAKDGVGIQKLELTNDLLEGIVGDHRYNYASIAENDGLHPADWLVWFSYYGLTRPIAIIHFTKFRY